MCSISSAPSLDATINPHVLIIGAGITGLTIAQALRKRALSSLPTPTFSIYERDPDPAYRGTGWGLTIHWALSDFESLLPQYLVDRLPESFVDAEAVKKGETGNFPLFDLQTGEDKHRVPPSKKIRVSRERLRSLLMDGLDIQWSKKLTTISTPGTQLVNATFEDGTKATGTLLIGADGSSSVVRKILCPENYTNNRLPVRLLGVSIPYTKQRCEVIQQLDPFFFQATDPATNAFMYFAFLKVPPQGSDSEHITCQILISWRFDDEFLGKGKPTETPTGSADRVRWMKEMSSGWTEPFKSIVHDIPEEGTEAKEIKLEDWPPEAGIWENKQGRVTLIGDAAHAMTMYRGEAANHGIADVMQLYTQLFGGENKTQAEAINKYEAEMIPRTKVAVLTSRKACLDAHDFVNINENSPLVGRRVMIYE